VTQLDRAAAGIELLRRQRSRESLAEFSLSLDIPGVPNAAFDDVDDEAEDVILKSKSGEDIFVPGAGRVKHRIEQRAMTYEPITARAAIHHIVMMNRIQRCIETPRGRCMVFAPPGSAKSTYGSVIAPAWAMGRKRNQNIIVASYATNIAVKQSRKVRAIARDPHYTCIWPSKPVLADDQRAIDDWTMSNGSGMMAAGLLAGITGNRADGLVIDDPVANREQADSATIREKTYQEFIDTAMTRAKPNMWALIIQTRWHEEDLAGSILPEYYAGESGFIKCRDGQTWDVLCIPAEAEREDDVLGRKVGDFLWPDHWPREHWSTWRDNPRAKRTWSALFQQRPAPDAGIHFSRDGFNYYDPDLPRFG
jgi:hypothetical protein